MASSKTPAAPHQDGRSNKAVSTVSLTGLDASRRVLEGIYLAATVTPSTQDARESPDPSIHNKQPQSKGNLHIITSIRFFFINEMCMFHLYH